LTGPLIKNKVAFTESFEYRFIRTPVDSLPQLKRDTKFEGFTWFNQVDVNLNAQQSMTATFTLYPQKLNYLGLAERQLIEVPSSSASTTSSPSH
jgi:hypothetical protein